MVVCGFLCINESCSDKVILIIKKSRMFFCINQFPFQKTIFVGVDSTPLVTKFLRDFQLMLFPQDLFYTHSIKSI